MQAALIGLPQSGKSTLFAAITSQTRPSGEPPGVRHGVVQVPDPRLDHLVGLYKPKKTTYATIEFIDYPGFSLDDARGRDEFRKHMAEVRSCEILVQVVRGFESAQVPAYRDRVDPAADQAELHEELIFADLETVSNRIEKIEKSLRRPSATQNQDKRELAVLEKCSKALEASEPLSTVIRSPDDALIVKSFTFLTEKPAVVVFNVGDDGGIRRASDTPAFAHSAIKLCAEVEAMIQELDPQDRGAFLADLGVEEPARTRLIRCCYDAMGLISFFTVGPKEVRAWTISRGMTAVEAAGKIHTDMARGFIRAETVAYDDLRAAGDIKSAKSSGKVRQEGKSYTVADGDVILFKFNV